MRKIRNFANKYGTALYFILTFAITWGSIFLLVGSIGFPISKEQIEAAGPLVYVGMLLGPSLAGLIMIALAEGREGFKDLFSRLGKWKVGLRWYATALLLVPALVLIILYALSLFNKAFLPAIFAEENKAGLIVMGVVMGLVVGFFEEIGWTGFVIPRMRKRSGILVTGLIVGLLWGAWHYPPFSPSVLDAGSIPPAVYIGVLLFSFLPAYRVLLVWIYEKTGSLLLVVLMHAPLSACQLVLIPPTLTGVKLVTYNLIFAAVLWIVAGLVLAANSKKVLAADAEPQTT